MTFTDAYSHISIQRDRFKVVATAIERPALHIELSRESKDLTTPLGPNL